VARTERRGGAARTERRTLVARLGGEVGRRGRRGEEEAKRRGGSCEEWWQSHCARIRVNEGASAGAHARAAAINARVLARTCRCGRCGIDSDLSITFVTIVEAG
jgi:hypothetical protein